MVKSLSTVRETWVWSLGQEDSLEKEMATHSSILAQKIPWMEEFGAGYCPWGHKESGTTEWIHFPKAHLTSHSRMWGSRLVITPLWLSRSLWSFLDSSSVYSFHFFISSAYVRSSIFLSFIRPILAWNALFIPQIFLRESLVFPLLLFSSIFCTVHFRKAFLFLLAIFWNSAFSWTYLSFSLCLSLLFFPQNYL